MVESAFKTTTFWYKFKWNFNSYSQTLTFLLITYTIYPSNVPVLLRSHQLRSLWATLRYQCDHSLQPYRVGCPSKYRKEKQWESIVIYKPHFLFLNDHPKNIWLNLLFNTTTFWYKFKWNLNSDSQTLTLLFITYTIYPSNVPLLFCWHQLRSLWATLQYQCDHFLQP